MDDQTTRLNRIEEKLDRVGEAIISLARMEERMITLFKRMDTYDNQQASLGERVTKVEVAQATQTGSSKWVDVVITAIITGAIGLVIYVSKQ